MLSPEQIEAALQAFGYPAMLCGQPTDHPRLILIRGSLPSDAADTPYVLAVGQPLRFIGDQPRLRPLVLQRWLGAGEGFENVVESIPLLPVLYWLEEAGFPRLLEARRLRKAGIQPV